MTKGKRRIEFIDLAKCIAIFLVVWGHAAPNDVLFGGNAPLLYRILYSTHMPLFFFLSGMSITSKPLKSWGEWRFFIRKCILTIAFPYFIWALIYCSFSLQSVGWIFYGSWKAMNYASSLTSLWYLPCLFVARILVEIILSLIGNYTKWNVKWAAFLIGASLIPIGVFLPKLPNGYFWCADIALVAAGCILLGVALRETLIKLSVQKVWVLLLLLTGSIGIFALTVILRGDRFTMMSMCMSDYGNGIGVVINAATGGFAVLIIAMLLRQLSESCFKNRGTAPFIYLGQHTLGVFLIHKPLMQMAIIPLLTSLAGSFLKIWEIRLLGAVIAIFVSLALCNVINHYVPELIGVFSKDKIAGEKVTDETITGEKAADEKTTDEKNIVGKEG